MALPLAWVCLNQTLADAADGPRQALTWSADAGRLARAADISYSEARQESDFAAATDLARRSLMAGPLESRALLVLAEDADRRGDRAGAAKLMKAVDARTKRETGSQLWLLRDALLREDYARAFRHADAVLRRRSDLSGLLFPVLISTLDDPRALAPLANCLSTPAPPEWRPGFLSNLASRNGAVTSQLVALIGRRSTLSPGEAKDVIDRLTQAGDYGVAYRTWRQLSPNPSPQPGALVYDGAFQGGAAPPPFNWRTKDEDGASADISSSADGRSALHVIYPSSQAHQLAEQLLMLPPGRYRFSAEGLGADGLTAARLKWSITCAGDKAVALAAVEQPAGGSWRRFGVDFETPPSGCAAQWLRLRSMPLDRFETVEAWTSRLAIRPLSASLDESGARSLDILSDTIADR